MNNLDQGENSRILFIYLFYFIVVFLFSKFIHVQDSKADTGFFNAQEVLNVK